MTAFSTEYQDYCQTHGKPERLELMLCDINAILRGKILPATSVDKLWTGGARLPLSTCVPNILGEEVAETGLGIATGDPDGILVPIPGTLKPVPWAAKATAQVQVEMTHLDGTVSAFSTRHMLAQVLERFTERGLRPVVATELEFYLLRARARADAPPRPPRRSPDAQNYDLEVLSRSDKVLSAILDASQAQGLATDTLIAEYGPGQFEINFHHTTDVLAAAETAILFRRVVRAVAASHDMEATFMAKPYADAPGNGMHVHASVLDDAGNNIFASDTGEPATALLNAVAGCLATMRPLQAIFAPHLNSFRRFQPNSFAPSAPDWGFDNRAASVRLPESQGPAARLEHRISGADVNPYLAIAAILGGILHGLDETPELPLPLDDPAAAPAAPLGHDWLTAVERMAQSEISRNIFGTPFHDAYIAVRRDEISKLSAIISPAEFRYYLSRL